MHRMLPTALLALAMTIPASAQAPPAEAPLPWIGESVTRLERELVAKHGDRQRERAGRGLQQVASFWRAEDGDEAAFEAFVRANFAGDQATIDALFERFERALELLNGHMLEIGREFRRHADLDLGPMLPIDRIMAGYSPAAHVSEDFFRNKLAFIALLNFPLTTLQQRLEEGDRWSRRQWAEVRLAQRFGRRVPASVNQEITRATAEANHYIAEYNIWMHHLLDEDGQRLFPERMRLLAHWNLRDQIKADYSEAGTALPRQRMIARVMERIVTQTIPEVVIDNPAVDWNPVTNEVRVSTVKDFDTPPRRAGMEATAAPEPNTRYATLLGTFRAVRLADPYSPTAPTHIARRFDENREIPEERFRAMLEQVVTSPLVPRVAALIEARLGRPLEPHDVWYNGFRPRGAYTEEQLDAITRKRYPTAAAFNADMPNILERLGFSPARARYLAERIEVDPARGSGHAMPAARRGDYPRLRTRIAADGMDYKGYNIAIHELGHNVEQVFSLYDVDHTLLQGVPNTAFTEALAFVFQAKDLEVLGLVSPDAESLALSTLNDFWGTYEIAGVALVDMAVWRWMYDNPAATPAQLGDATVRIARETWNRYYAPVFKQQDVVLLGIYSHMIQSMLYLPDYPLGHMIAHQIREQIDRAGDLGREFERMSVYGNVTPDAWMQHATGAPVGPQALLAATKRSLEWMDRQKGPTAAPR
jgi:hypothetical protein